LANHLWASQSACAKITIHLCGIHNTLYKWATCLQNISNISCNGNEPNQSILAHCKLQRFQTLETTCKLQQKQYRLMTSKNNYYERKQLKNQLFPEICGNNGKNIITTIININFLWPLVNPESKDPPKVATSRKFFKLYTVYL